MSRNANMPACACVLARVHLLSLTRSVCVWVCVSLSLSRTHADRSNLGWSQMRATEAAAPWASTRGCLPSPSGNAGMHAAALLQLALALRRWARLGAPVPSPSSICTRPTSGREIPHLAHHAHLSRRTEKQPALATEGVCQMILSISVRSCTCTLTHVRS